MLGTRRSPRLHYPHRSNESLPDGETVHRRRATTPVESSSRAKGIRQGTSSDQQTGVIIIPAQRAGLAVLPTAVVAAGSWVPAQDSEKVLESIHFLIPSGSGGSWDGTAGGTREALTKSGIIASASCENMPGGGRKSIGNRIENAVSNRGTLMVNSTPIIIRSPSRPVGGRWSCACASTNARAATGSRSPSTKRRCFPENSANRGPVTPFRWCQGRTRSRCLRSAGAVSRDLLAAMRT